MKCRFCHRPLLSRASIARGYGPICGNVNKAKIGFEDAEKSGQINLIRVLELKQKIIETARRSTYAPLRALIRELDKEEGRG